MTGYNTAKNIDMRVFSFHCDFVNQLISRTLHLMAVMADGGCEKEAQLRDYPYQMGSGHAVGEFSLFLIYLGESSPWWGVIFLGLRAYGE